MSEYQKEMLALEDAEKEIKRKAEQELAALAERRKAADGLRVKESQEQLEHVKKLRILFQWKPEDIFTPAELRRGRSPGRPHGTKSSSSTQLDRTEKKYRWQNLDGSWQEWTGGGVCPQAFKDAQARGLTADEMLKPGVTPPASHERLKQNDRPKAAAATGGAQAPREAVVSA